jgi:ABC-type multidrug transport system permease subunit
VSRLERLLRTIKSLTCFLGAVLEERANYRKESSNGLSSPLPFVLANTIVTIPFLLVCSCLFVLIMYWGIVSLLFQRRSDLSRSVLLVSLNS